MYLQRFWREVFDTWSPWLPGSPPVCAAYTCLSSAPSCISRKPLRWNLCSVWGHCKTVFHIWNLLYLYETVRNVSMKYKRKFVDDRNTRFLVFFLFVFFFVFSRTEKQSPKAFDWTPFRSEYLKYIHFTEMYLCLSFYS